MEQDIKLSVIIPTYNEEGNIAALLQTTHQVLHSVQISHELIVVDDNSKDRTRAIVRELQSSISEIQLIERDHERGLAGAMVRGYDAAHGAYLGSMDADLAHDPKCLPDMVAMLDGGNADFVIGSRYVPGARFEGKAFVNKVASAVGQILIKGILGLRVKDTSNNYRVFRRDIWEQIKTSLHPTGNIMLTEIAYRAHLQGAKIVEIPIHYIERRAGKSKLSVVRETLQFFRNIFKIKFGR